MVTFETKCWEADWRLLLTAGYLEEQVARNQFSFTRRTLLINNVTDPEEVTTHARRLVEAGVLTDYQVVGDHADEALAFFELSRNSLERGYVYSIAELVGIYLCQTPYLLHFAGDAILEAHCDWVPEAVRELEADPMAAVANPTWNGCYQEVAQASQYQRSDFFIGEGFSDQCYLVRAADFRAPIYGERHMASERYPAHGGDSFEKRVDAWMRTHRRYRLTHKRASYRHLVGFRDRAAHAWHDVVTRGAGVLPVAATSVEELTRYVESLGSDNVSAFGGTFEGGYCLQQVPAEIAQLIVYLREQGREFENYLEIGAAAGGSVRLLTDLLPIRNVFVVDDDKHAKAERRAENFRHLKNSGVLKQWVGDSHTSGCKEFLRGLDVQFDLVLLDGDHSYTGAKADLELVLPFCRPGAMILLHDSDKCAGVRRLAQEVSQCAFPELELIFNIVNPAGTVRLGTAGLLYKASQTSLRMSARTDSANPRANGSTGVAPKCSPEPDLCDLVPSTARRILHIGCGAGQLGESLKKDRAAEIIGIEKDPTRAQEAGKRLDRVQVGDIESMNLEFPEQSFDCVICGALLPRLRAPERLLRRARAWLKPAGCLVARVPNLRHHRVVSTLLEGKWTYKPEAPLHAQQLRFYTRRELEKLLYRTGFTVPTVQAIPPAAHAPSSANGYAGQVRIGNLQLGTLSDAEADEFHVEEYLLRALPAEPADHGLTSIVIVTHNELSFTRQCLDSIALYTDEPYELIIVDNASSDSTAEYLRSLSHAKVICNAENRGFPAAANQGIQAATGSQILLLNNDCVVATGWLRRLLQALQSDPKIGLVGPCSNHVSGEQEVAVSYDDDLVGLDGFAWEWGKSYNGVIEDTDRLVGFCLLIRRELIESIGLLDEQFGIGCFEDDDYCLRALRSGYRAVIARDAFVHHFGSRTFIGSGVDFNGVMQRNRELFQKKWNGAARIPARVADSNTLSLLPAYGVRLLASGGLLLEPRSVQLSVCMIVRDSARTIQACLESIKPWVDEMIVVDTGSKDDTPQIAAALGARVYHFPWCDSFAAARNESLRYARGAWVFWMDSDDTIDAENGRKLWELVRTQAAPSLLGYVMQVHCPGPSNEDDGDMTVVDHVKVFRNLPQLRFEGRIHEQILPAIRRAGGDIAWTDLFVVHSGYDHSPDGQEKKKERDLHLLRLELSEQPNHPFTLFNLGMTYCDLRQYDEAAGYLERSIVHSGVNESHLRKVYALLVHAYAQLGNDEKAWDVCRRGLELFPLDAELRFRKALLLHARGNLTEAAATYRDVLERHEERHFTSVDCGIAGAKARQNLAVVYSDMNDYARAEEQWRLIIEELPHYRQGWRGLGDALVRQAKYNAALDLAQQQLDDPRLRAEGLLLQGQVAVSQGQIEEARHFFEQAVHEYPQDVDALRVLCPFLFQHADDEAAARALAKLTELDPSDPSTYHNLGTVNLRMHRYQAAVEAFQQSLCFRPDSVPTYLHLGHALRGMGNLNEAADAWQRTLQLDPDNSAAREALAFARDGASPVGTGSFVVTAR